MQKIKEETIIDTSPQPIFDFLTHIDSLYKVWHPKDHVFCKTLFRTLDKTGCIFHFLEIIGWFPLYIPTKVTKIEPNRYIEYEPIFSLSFFKPGFAYFKIESISAQQSKLTAYVQWGWKSPVLSPLFDAVANLLIRKKVAEQHIREEGLNLKRYVETSQSTKANLDLSMKSASPSPLRNKER